MAMCHAGMADWTSQEVYEYPFQLITEDHFIVLSLISAKDGVEDIKWSIEDTQIQIFKILGQYSRLSKWRIGMVIMIFFLIRTSLIQNRSLLQVVSSKTAYYYLTACQ